jgi:peptidoglycan hydrolase CwlO-like protein
VGNQFPIKSRIFKLLFFPIVFAFTIYLLPFTYSPVNAEPNCDNPGAGDYDYCIQKIKQEYDALAPAQEKNKQDLAALNTQLVSLNAKITKLSTQLKNLESQILNREEDLAYTKEIFDEKARDHYTFLRLYDPITPFLFSDSASQAFQEIVMRQKAADSDRKVMEEYATDLSSLKTDKETLEKSKVSLSSLQSQVAEKQKFLAGEVAKVDTYLSTLSAKQEALLAAKSGSFITSVGDVELADDYNASIKGFREAAPSGSFAVFSFGGYTHRKGMSQYGARGRAENGQKYGQILKAYYGKEPVGKDTGGTISVSGYGSMDFETKYLYGIAEMPSGWNAEALKAQAVAARTYAYRYKTAGTTICTTQTCQVFSKSKSDNPPSSWKQAVDDTKGQVLEDVVTYYSSTTGGYSLTSGWDTTDGSGGSSFIDKAYEKLGGSPWLYKAWYRQGYTSTGATCGKGNPWLSNEEFTDIVNAALVLKNGSDSRIVPVTSCVGGGGGYSYAELREKGGVSSTTSVTVTQGNGATTNVIINGNINLTGNEFKQAFNLRAPGYIRIPQGIRFGSSVEFAFFNIEKK